MNISQSGASEDGLLEDLFHRAMLQMPIICTPEEPRCDERPFTIFLMGNGFLMVFGLALIGNCLNLIAYKSDQIRFYLAIRMLCTRLLINTAAMIFMLPQALKTIGIWSRDGTFDHIYWIYYPYMMYCANIFGFCSMWLTVLMTGECYLHVFFPSQSKSWCTIRNLVKSYAVMFVTGALLTIHYPLNRKVQIGEDRCNRTVVSIHASKVQIIQILDRIHTVAHLTLGILLPLMLLVFMTFSIVWKLLIRRPDMPNASHFTTEKKAVVRITLITTLIFELPSAPVFVMASAFDPSVINDPYLCVWNTTGVFLSLCNMSLSFFIYMALSNKFRQMVCTCLDDVLHRYILCKGKSSMKMVVIEPERSTSRTYIGPNLAINVGAATPCISISTTATSISTLNTDRNATDRRRRQSDFHRQICDNLTDINPLVINEDEFL